MKTCPKCRYERKNADDKVPEWQCPACGIAYAKYEERKAADGAARRAVPPVEAAPAPPMSAKALFFILAGVVAIGYAGYRHFGSSKIAPAEADSEILEVNHPAYFGTKGAGGPVLRMKPEPLAQLHTMTPARVVMFGTTWCPYCAKARELFAKQGVRYAELDLEKDGAAADFQKNVMGLSGFPTLVIGNRVIQGFDEPEIVEALKEL